MRIRPREIQEVYTSKGYEETTQQRQGVNRVGRVEARKQNERGAKSGSSESDIVKWVHSIITSILIQSIFRSLTGYLHLSAELAQRFVEVIHLRQDADRGEDHENVSRWVSELVVPGKRKLQRNAEGLYGHDRDGPNS